jgi:hypothetical protein
MLIQDFSTRQSKDSFIMPNIEYVKADFEKRNRLPIQEPVKEKVKEVTSQVPLLSKTKTTSQMPLPPIKESK